MESDIGLSIVATSLAGPAVRTKELPLDEVRADEKQHQDAEEDHPGDESPDGDARAGHHGDPYGYHECHPFSQKHSQEIPQDLAAVQRRDGKEIEDPPPEVCNPQQ